MANNSEYRLVDQIGYKLRLANQRHLEVFSRLMPEVTSTQFAVLASLRDQSEVSQNQLGRMVGMDAATTKGVIDRLMRKDLVKRARSPRDQRRLHISLTDEGHRFIEEAVERASEISAQTTAKLTPREAQRLQDLLDKL